MFESFQPHDRHGKPKSCLDIAHFGPLAYKYIAQAATDALAATRRGHKLLTRLGFNLEVNSRLKLLVTLDFKVQQGPAYEGDPKPYRLYR